ncbi:hypothetical protein CEUSTIGMA_g1006.t1 [Chlamydomonas eustigma]|uniref:Uncharacterized protein n=1 Tax=Chlamydomonas eustigma TaxID=1157962 RepID=A0A250WRU0_9CHLO|nr:hypothetical protein CEUSTIGMA_g1006.t1 [Chlamydomonas eustigma]|eukprot:GAX73555.1 hypothetical protein CEUSTIGMA_g1006.t1 [Chlamydomonas eustigma]
MSDDDDDAPIIQRLKSKSSSAADENSNKVDAIVKEEPLDANKPTVADENGSDDEPIGLRRSKATSEAMNGERNGKSEISRNSKETRPAAKSKPVKREPQEDESTEVKVVVKKEKKVFELPGQTRETPPETDPLRKFYTSLLSQRPDSDMALKWCLMHGLLSEKDAKAALAKIGKGTSRSTPVKSEPSRKAVKREPKEEPVSKGAVGVMAGGRKRPKVKYEDDFDESEDDEEVKKKPAASKKEATKKPVGVKKEEEEEDEDEKPLSSLISKKRVAVKSEAPAAAPNRTTIKDVAFRDGGMEDDDDEDEKPLSLRRK